MAIPVPVPLTLSLSVLQTPDMDFRFRVFRTLGTGTGRFAWVSRFQVPGVVPGPRTGPGLAILERYTCVLEYTCTVPVFMNCNIQYCVSSVLACSS